MSSLYLQIKDDFYYSDFLGLKIIVDKKTGFFNATKLCVSGGKQFYDWFHDDRTQKLWSYLRRYEHNHTIVLNYDINDSNDEISGTYVHEDLILDLALWISPKFYIICKKIIMETASNRTAIG